MSLFYEKIPMSAWSHNKKELQGLNSNVCEQYCVYYVVLRCREKSMDSILRAFFQNVNEYTIILSMNFAFSHTNAKKSEQVSFSFNPM